LSFAGYGVEMRGLRRWLIVRLLSPIAEPTSQRVTDHGGREVSS